MKINLKDGADVTLQNVNIEQNGEKIITCEGNVTIRLSGTNQIKASSAPLMVDGQNSTLTIEEGDANGSLELSNSDDYHANSALLLNNEANLIIESGIIEANASISKFGAAGIGSGSGGICGDITINGGKIKAYGGIGGPGIGAEGYSTCGIIKITGGEIEAIGGYGYYGGSDDACGAGIGAGINATCEEIQITGDAMVKATGGSWPNDPERWAFDIGPGYKYSSCGAVTIESSAIVTATNGNIYRQSN